MVSAADYPFLDIFWTMLIFFAWVIWFWILIKVITDIFRRHDISGWGKAGWTLFVIVLPFLGVFIYLIANGDEMGQRDVAQAQAAQAQFDDYVRSVSVPAAPSPRSRRPNSCSTAEPSRRTSSTRSRRRRSPRRLLKESGSVRAGEILWACSRRSPVRLGCSMPSSSFGRCRRARFCVVGRAR